MLARDVVFCAGSLIAAVGTSTDMMWAGRAVMRLGAAASERVTLSMIRRLYQEGRSRAVALGVWAAVSGLALASGPILGGLLVGVVVHKVVAAAYGAFSTGLDISLSIAASLMFVASIAALCFGRSVSPRRARAAGGRPAAAAIS